MENRRAAIRCVSSEHHAMPTHTSEVILSMVERRP